MGCGRNHLSLHGLSIIDAMAPADYILNQEAHLRNAVGL